MTFDDGILKIYERVLVQDKALCLYLSYVLNLLIIFLMK